MIATRVVKLDSEHPDRAILDEAARVLLAGGLVAFATETVYGLGAIATDTAAVRRIFAAKGRPAINPLIVHAADEAMARTCTREWPAAASRLAALFWPGPLTLVLPRSAIIPDEVTAGLPAVAVRVPNHVVARGIIKRVGRPLAAPSANRSSGISPTLAEHVRKDLEGKVDLILDSGPTQVGLESTVLDLSGGRPRILRPGVITAEMLRDVLGEVVEAEDRAVRGAFTSPGQMPVHYSPRVPTLRVPVARVGGVSWPESAALVVVGHEELRVAVPLERVSVHHLATPEQAARELYRVLHQCEESGVSLIVIVPPPDEPAWSAVRDRVWRAAKEGDITSSPFGRGLG